jgi:hypothetical protein
VSPLSVVQQPNPPQRRVTRPISGSLTRKIAAPLLVASMPGLLWAALSMVESIPASSKASSISAAKFKQLPSLQTMSNLTVSGNVLAISVNACFSQTKATAQIEAFQIGAGPAFSGQCPASY